MQSVGVTHQHKEIAHMQVGSSNTPTVIATVKRSAGIRKNREKAVAKVILEYLRGRNPISCMNEIVRSFDRK
jgi:hypothetical protein